jgi:hypothetical protein
LPGGQLWQWSLLQLLQIALHHHLLVGVVLLYLLASLQHLLPLVFQSL